MRGWANPDFYRSACETSESEPKVTLSIGQGPIPTSQPPIVCASLSPNDALSTTSEADIRRRDFIKFIAGSGVAWPLAARAQQGERVRRVGVLSARAATDPVSTEDIGAFAQGLAELGWTIGRNVRI